MSADRNREAMLRFYEAINQHDVDAVGDCIAEDNVAHCLPEELGQTREDCLGFVQTAFEAFPDFRFEVLDVVAEGDRVAARFRNTGTHEGELMGIPASAQGGPSRWKAATSAASMTRPGSLPTGPTPTTSSSCWRRT